MVLLSDQEKARYDGNVHNQPMKYKLNQVTNIMRISHAMYGSIISHFFLQYK
jgi:hypothetical protein